MVFHIAQRIPNRGEIIENTNGVKFRILDIDPRRIKIMILPPYNNEEKALSMTGKILRHPNILAFVCGSLCVGALPPYYLFPLLFAGLSGLLYLIDGAPSSRKAFGIAYAFGFAFFAFGLSWIGNALLIDAQTFGWLYPVVFLACGFFFGLFIAVPGWLAFRLFHSSASRWLAFSSFALFEWIRSFILTGFPESAWLGLRFQPRNDSVCFSSGNLRFVPHLPAVLLGTLFLPSPQNAKNLAAAICIPLVGLGFLYGSGYFRLRPAPSAAVSNRHPPGSAGDPSGNEVESPNP
ncbi:MAG: hypothetical protein ACLU99_00085 [Alphaproteobacteria bacterium]